MPSHKGGIATQRILGNRASIKRTDWEYTIVLRLGYVLLCHKASPYANLASLPFSTSTPTGVKSHYSLTTTSLLINTLLAS